MKNQNIKETLIKSGLGIDYHLAALKLDFRVKLSKYIHQFLKQRTGAKESVIFWSHQVDLESHSIIPSTKSLYYKAK